MTTALRDLLGVRGDRSGPIVFASAGSMAVTAGERVLVRANAPNSEEYAATVVVGSGQLIACEAPIAASCEVLRRVDDSEVDRSEMAGLPPGYDDWLCPADSEPKLQLLSGNTTQSLASELIKQRFEGPG